MLFNTLFKSVTTVEDYTKTVSDWQVLVKKGDNWNIYVHFTDIKSSM